MNKKTFSYALLAILLTPLVSIATEREYLLAQNKPAKTSKSKTSINMVCPTDTKWGDICLYFNKYQPKKYSDKLNKRNIEKELGEVCINSDVGFCSEASISIDDLYKMGIQHNDDMFSYLLKEKFVIRASLVDVNNDGNEEIRLWRTVGSASCQQSYFWEKDALSGSYNLINAKGYQYLAEEGSGCGSHLIFVPYMKSIFILVIQYDPTIYEARISRIWKGTKKELIEICSSCDN